MRNIAIAYALKKKRKKMADGGMAKPSPTPQPQSPVSDEQAKKLRDSMQSVFAKGGEVGSHAENHAYNYDSQEDMKGVHKVLPRYDKENKRMTHGESTANLNWAKSPKEKHQDVLYEMRSMPKPKLKGLAHGGGVEAAMEEDDMDLNQQMVMPEDSDEYGIVDRIMEKRSPTFESEARLSEGGQVSNDTEPFEHDFDTPNEFDDLVLDDDPESSYTGANSGDKLGNEQEDEDRHDIVARIMASRRKKDRNPRPA